MEHRIMSDFIDAVASFNENGTYLDFSKPITEWCYLAWEKSVTKSHISKPPDKQESYAIQHLRERRDMYCPSFTLVEAETFFTWNSPSAYMCCSGCDDCRCCAGVCFHT